ncbi:hypothetical protein LEP1GSC043_1697 [Leptospira weilii str. Ecochallenge]|uniref:Uncharacterized protein n=2 Tax=Leptospira weilii TaxID=28184 RepID=N1U327_9LEPT|nr:hypothetical protein LEP1GSC038_3831 [Leptospira weilii str. 2006001855]EMY12516.1 hypothetical protein LEP1GSC043_1697 [Leptospira weilii str. Ecochallenge]
MSDAKNKFNFKKNTKRFHAHFRETIPAKLQMSFEKSKNYILKTNGRNVTNESK